MNRKILIIGSVFLVLGLWFSLALSSFQVEEGLGMKRIVLRQGVEMSEEEVARELADSMNFDLEGAYTMGYSTQDVIEYLMNAPRDTSITFSEGTFYKGRQTVPYIFPFSVSVLFLLIGIFLMLFGWLRKGWR